MSTTTTVPINSSAAVTSKSTSDSNSYGGSDKNYHQQQREQSTLPSTVTINNRENANNSRNNLHHLSKKSNSSSGGSNNSIHNTSSSSLGAHHQGFNVTSHQPLPNLNPFTNITNHQNHSQNHDLIEIKSKFEAEFRRFSVQRSEITNLEDFIKLIEHFHKLFTISFCLFYTDPNHDLLPINNDTNFKLAIQSAKPLLRLIVQRKGESCDYLNNYGKKKTNFLGNILPVVSSSSSKNRLAISAPEDFRQVSSIIDVDIVPETCRRVRLVKHGSEKPLGFYIRDGSSVRITERGLQKVPGIFISRLVPGGLAESTGLLAESDEVLEVNGIEVNGKSLDQVTDMMVANSSNLIITIRPANQRAGHNTLSSSYSSNTISNHHPSATLQHGTMTTDRHHYHHSNNNYYNQHHHNNHHHHHHHHHHPNSAQQYTNSLERSGHRSKVADYYPSYQPRHDSSASYHQQYLHHRTSSDVIEDDDDDDEDEVRDHINVNNNDSCNNGSTSNNVTLATSSTSSSSSLPPNKSASVQLLTASVFSIPPPTTNAATVECITIGPVKGGNTNNNNNSNNHNNTNNGNSTGVNSANSSNADSDIVTL